MITVLGHTNPDTDTTCSAIAYAWYLNHHGKNAKAVRTGELTKETKFVLDYFGIETPELLTEITEEHTIALVDTNNPEELLPGWEKARLVSVVDHHKLVGGLSSPDPIAFVMEPVACTTTIILGIMDDSSVVPSKEIAGIMIAAILSDTLKFTSPTTTEVDMQAAERLAQIAELHINEFAASMFAAKSDLSGMSNEDILHVDSKVFTLTNQKCMISVLESTHPENAIAMRESLEQTMREMKERDGLDIAMLFVIDIINTSAELIVPSNYEREIASRTFQKHFDGETLTLPGVVSRKKQIVPRLEYALKTGREDGPAVASVDDTVFFPELLGTHD